MSNSLQIKNDKILCIHFEIIKLCAFILAGFRNVRDCMIMENPLKLMIAHMSAVLVEFNNESSFAPLVTSIIPYKTHLIRFLGMWAIFVICEIIHDRKLKIFKISKTSDNK